MELHRIRRWKVRMNTGRPDSTHSLRRLSQNIPHVLRLLSSYVTTPFTHATTAGRNEQRLFNIELLIWYSLVRYASVEVSLRSWLVLFYLADGSHCDWSRPQKYDADRQC